MCLWKYSILWLCQGILCGRLAGYFENICDYRKYYPHYQYFIAVNILRVGNLRSWMLGPMNWWNLQTQKWDNFICGKNFPRKTFYWKSHILFSFLVQIRFWQAFWVVKVNTPQSNGNSQTFCLNPGKVSTKSFEHKSFRWLHLGDRFSI